MTVSLKLISHVNINKIKELIVDFLKHTPSYISGGEVKQVNSFRFLGINITENLSRTSHSTIRVRKAQKQLYFSRKLKRAKLLFQVLLNLSTGGIESILTGNITNWYGMCTVGVCISLTETESIHISIHVSHSPGYDASKKFLNNYCNNSVQYNSALSRCNLIQCNV